MIILTHEILEKVTDNIAFIVLVKSIAKRASFDSKQSCFPGTAKMMKDTGLSRSSVIRGREWLAQAGIIKIVKKGKTKDGQYQVNEYSIKTNLIKVVGDLQSSSEEKEAETSVSEKLPSVSEKPPLVSQMDSNLKSNITSSPINEREKIFEILNHPLFEINKDKKFPTLAQEDIELTLLNALVDNPRLTFNQALNWLTNEAKGFSKSKPNSNPTPQTKTTESDNFELTAEVFAQQMRNLGMPEKDIQANIKTQNLK